MRTHQYVRQERQIAAADTNGIRERWLWGLRLLRDPKRMQPSGLQLVKGVIEELTDAAKSAGINLSASEIRYRLQCARTYKTEAEITKALGDFKTWWSLIQDNFPAYETDEDEPPADHRTPAERLRDDKALAEEAYGSQPVLDGMELFVKLDPATATLKDVFRECEKSEDMTANFDRYDRKRRAQANRWLAASGGDISMTIADADAKVYALLHAGTP